MRSQGRQVLQGIFALMALGLVGAYIAGVLLGFIPKEQKLGAVDLALIVIAVFVVAFSWNPGVLGTLKKLEIKGVMVEFDRFRKKQKLHEDQLEAIRLILPLLLPEMARRHLMNLAKGKTKDYKGRESLRGELRRLRSLELIEMREGKQLGEIQDGAQFDLAEFIQPTDLGRQWAEKLSELERDKAAGDETRRD